MVVGRGDIIALAELEVRVVEEETVVMAELGSHDKVTVVVEVLRLKPGVRVVVAVLAVAELPVQPAVAVLVVLDWHPIFRVLRLHMQEEVVVLSTGPPMNQGLPRIMVVQEEGAQARAVMGMVFRAQMDLAVVVDVAVPRVLDRQPAFLIREVLEVQA